MLYFQVHYLFGADETLLQQLRQQVSSNRSSTLQESALKYFFSRLALEYPAPTQAPTRE